jgi:hypothetical protein
MKIILVIISLSLVGCTELFHRNNPSSPGKYVGYPTMEVDSQ